MTVLRPKPGNDISDVERKWIKPLVEAGWTAIPSVIFERQHTLGLDALDMNIILHLAGHWWTAGNAPHPSKVTIATAIGVTPRSVQRRIAKLERAGFIKRTSRQAKKGGTATSQLQAPSPTNAGLESILLAGPVGHPCTKGLQHPRLENRQE